MHAETESPSTAAPRSPVVDCVPEYVPDAWPGVAVRLGLVALSLDHAMEGELRRMLPTGVADFYVSRVPVRNPCTVVNLRAMAADLTRAAELILPGTPIDALAFGCTSGTVVIGSEEVQARLQAARPGVPCTTPITAALAAFARLGITRVAMLTPYIEEVNAPIREFLAARGVRVVASATFGLVDDIAMTRIPPAAVRDAALALDRPEAQAVFISCTALRVSSIIEPLEHALGKPVVASNQAIAWDALRLAGRGLPVSGFGRLLRTHC